MQRKIETDNSGQGPYGRQIYPGYRGLAKLPWFELDNAGNLHCKDKDVPYAIDVHCHLGMSVLFRPKLWTKQYGHTQVTVNIYGIGHVLILTV